VAEATGYCSFELDRSNVECFVALSAWADFKFYRLPLFEVSVAFAFDVAEVHEYIFAFVTRNEAITLLTGEELHGSGWHCLLTILGTVPVVWPKPMKGSSVPSDSTGEYLGALQRVHAAFTNAPWPSERTVPLLAPREWRYSTPMAAGAPDWLSMEYDGQRWSFDADFLRSRWTCVWDRGCHGIESTTDAPAGLGCW